MDLGQHAAVLWRFRAIVAAGLTLGIVLAFLAAYQVSWDGGPSVTHRGTETWSSDSSLLVSQAGAPELRSTYPPQSERGQLQFAAPERFSNLANFYAELANTDGVRLRLPEHPKPGQIEAHPVEGAAGQPILPVIKLTTFDESAAGARAMNKHLVAALIGVVTSGQAQNQIPASQRVELSLLNRPTEPVKTSGTSNTASILAFLLCIIGAVAVAHLLAMLRDREDAEAVEGVVVPWASEQDDWQQPQPAPVTPATGGRDGTRAQRLRAASDRQSR
jgi:hypothetical protein